MAAFAEALSNPEAFHSPEVRATAVQGAVGALPRPTDPAFGLTAAEPSGEQTRDSNLTASTFRDNVGELVGDEFAVPARSGRRGLLMVPLVAVAAAAGVFFALNQGPATPPRLETSRATAPPWNPKSCLTARPKVHLPVCLDKVWGKSPYQGTPKISEIDKPAAEGHSAASSTSTASSPSTPAKADRPRSHRFVALTVKTTPSGANLFVDGAPKGFTPAQVDIPQHSGKHVFEVSKNGFKSQRHVVTAQEDRTFRWHLAPKLSPSIRSAKTNPVPSEVVSPKERQTSARRKLSARDKTTRSKTAPKPPKNVAAGNEIKFGFPHPCINTVPVMPQGNQVDDDGVMAPSF